MTKYEKRRQRCRRCARFEKPKANARLVAKNTLVLYFRMLVVMAVGLYTGRVLLKALGVADYGLQNVAGAVIGAFTFINGSLATASSRFLTVEMGKGTIGSLKRTFSTVLTVHFILACIFVLLLETVGLVFLQSKLNIDPSRIFAVKWIYQCSVVSLFLGVTQVPYSAAIVAHERMGAFAWMAIYDVVVKLLIAISLMHYAGDRLILNGTLWLLSSITTIMIYRIYCIRNFTEARYRRVFDKDILKPIFSFAGWQIASQTMWMLLTQGLIMINQRYFGPALVAAVSVASTVNGHVQSFINNFKTASVPQIVKLFAAGEYAESKRLLIDMVHISVFLLLLLGVPICFYSREILTLWLGDAVPPHSAAFVVLLLSACFFYLFETSFYQVFYAAARIKENALANIVLGLCWFAVAWLVVKWTYNPFTTCVVLMLHHFVQGVVVKPLLAHFLVQYTWRDIREVFKMPIIASCLCLCVAYGVKSMMPDGLFWVIPSCLLIFALNVILLYSFVVSDRMESQVTRLLVRIPCIGPAIISNLSLCRRCARGVRSVCR